MAKRSKSSNRWMTEHFDDEFVLLAQKEGYRSRAVYKLKELDDKYQLLRSGMSVVDLGAAPGGWTQYAKLKVGDHGMVIASDILKMDPIAGVEFVVGDFTEESVFDEILQTLDRHNQDGKTINSRRVDLVISDMAPNMSGIDSVDIPKAMYLVELAADFAQHTLRDSGSFVCKMFQGEGSDAFLVNLRKQYASVMVKKPKASRARSREVYVYAKGFKMAV